MALILINTSYRHPVLTIIIKKIPIMNNLHINISVYLIDAIQKKIDIICFEPEANPLVCLMNL